MPKVLCKISQKHDGDSRKVYGERKLRKFTCLLTDFLRRFRFRLLLLLRVYRRFRWNLRVDFVSAIRIYKETSRPKKFLRT